MKHTYFAFQIEHSVKIQSYYNVPPVNLNTIVALKILQWKDFIQIIPIKTHQFLHRMNMKYNYY